MSQNTDPVVIVGAARTALGSLLGCFKDIPCPELGGTAIRAAVAQSNVDPTHIETSYMGCVLPAGQGQAPARQATLAAGLSKHTSAITLNKMCGSGMAAIMLAHDGLLAESFKIAVAGGMENMSQAPHLLPLARQGYRLGHRQVMDHLFLDGLEDAYERGQLMGVFAERCAEQLDLSRATQDQFALASLERAQRAQHEGWFKAEIAPHEIKLKKDEITISHDENPLHAKKDKIPLLSPVFKSNGTITAANASSISDGAAAVVLMRLSHAERLGLTPLARIVGHSTFADEPSLFPTAPIGALKHLFEKTGWSAKDVDLFEINEAFAVVTLAAMKAFNLPHEQVNIHGGACALGHPIGASGARIVVTLLNALQQHHLKRGVATLCIGGGEATALGIELL